MSNPDPDFDITEHVEIVHYEVESRHHIHATQCLCGFQSYVSRDRTRHIVTETLIAAGLEERPAEEAPRARRGTDHEQEGGG